MTAVHIINLIMSQARCYQTIMDDLWMEGNLRTTKEAGQLFIRADGLCESLRKNYPE